MFVALGENRAWIHCSGLTLISRAWCVLVPGPAACLALLTLPSHRLPRCSLEESRFVNQDCGSCAPIFGCAKACHVCHATEHSSSASQHEADVMQTLITEGSRISSGRNFPGSTLMNFGLDDWNAYANECIHGPPYSVRWRPSVRDPNNWLKTTAAKLVELQTGE